MESLGEPEARKGGEPAARDEAWDGKSDQSSSVRRRIAVRALLIPSLDNPALPPMDAPLVKVANIQTLSIDGRTASYQISLEAIATPFAQ